MELSYEEKLSLCALNRIFGFEPRIALALISSLGSAYEVFQMDEKQMDGILGPYSRYRNRICPEELERSAAELEKLKSQGCGFIGISEDCFPQMLRESEDPPAGLYYKSESSPKDIFKENMISVVGTRDISPYGKEWCERIVRSMMNSGTTIVSGLAYGTDITAHLAALDCGLPTIAVMATGIDSIYPFRHQYYADRIAAAPSSALISDYPPGTAPVPNNFLRRNRIIAALSSATILVESKIRGGGMMTARLAFSYNREVYALPGRADDVRSQGCNRLIAEKTAEPIEDTASLLKNLGLSTANKNRKSLQQRVSEVYSGKLEVVKLNAILLIFKYIQSHRGAGADDISEGTGIPARMVSIYISMLENDGFISTDLLGRCCITGF